MLKHKTKDELLELLYKANLENHDLQICNNQQSETLKSIAELYLAKGFFARLLRFFALPFKILQVLKKHNDYFYTILNELEKMELTREQCVTAQKAIVDFENKKIGVAEYKTLVTGMLGISENCGTCGDVSGRLHDDFQKRVAEECRTKYPELLPTPPALKSGQFTGDFYANCLRTYHFKGLESVVSKMKSAALNAKSRGNLPQEKMILDDLERVKEFIQARKLGLETNEETTGVVDLGEIEVSDEDIEEFVNESKKGVLNEVEKLNFEVSKKELEVCVLAFYELPKEQRIGEIGNDLKAKIDRYVLELNSWKEAAGDFALAKLITEITALETTEAEKQKKVYTNEEAKTLYDSGMTLQDLGIYYGVDASTIKRRLDKYNAILEAANKDLNEGE